MTTVASYSIPGFGEVNVVQQNDAGNRFCDLFAASGEWLNEGHPFRYKPRRVQVEAFLAQRLKEALVRMKKECKRFKITQEDLFAASGEWLNEGHPFRYKPRRVQVEAFLAQRLKEA